MKRLVVIAPLLLLLTGLIPAQVFLPHRFIASHAVPTNVGPLGLSPAYWWVASDLATNATASSWTDRVQHVLITQGDSTKQPTNTSSGLSILNGRRMTNEPPFPSPTQGISSNECALAFIFRPTTYTANGGMLWYPTNATQGNGFFTDVTNKLSFGGPVNATNFCRYVTNTAYDVVIAQNGSNALTYYYTNGVFISQNRQGMPGALRYVGTYQDGASFYFEGYIIEMLIFTNALSQAQVTLLHNYATNTYGYTP